MRCEELMKRDVQYLLENDTVLTAARRMRDHNIGFLPVCAADRTVKGTLTDRDIAIRVAADDFKASECPVLQVMTREVVACHPRDDVRDCEKLMAQHHKSRILCLDDRGQLAGVISLSDIARTESNRWAAKTLREISERESRAH